MKSSLLSVIFILGLIFSSGSYGQNGIYFANKLPQSNSLNPAIQPNFKFYISAPGPIPIPSLNLKFISGFSQKDLFSFTQNDSFKINWDGIDKMLTKRNYIRMDFAFTALSFGFKVQDYYFSFDATLKSNFQLSFPKGLNDLKNGNWDPINRKGNQIDLSDLGVKSMSYIEYALGVSKPINSQWTVGGKLKILTSGTCIDTKKSDLKIETFADENGVPDYIKLTTDIEFRTSSIPMDIYQDSTGYIDSLEINDVEPNSFFGNKNNGLAFDLGASYNLNNQITLYASILDIGFMKFKTEPNVIKSTGTYTFNGIEIDDITNTEGREFGTELLDSLKDGFHFSTSKDKFTKWLSPKFYVGGTYLLTERVNLGALTRIEYFAKRLRPSLTLSANLAVTKGSYVQLHYTMEHKTFNTIGFGFAFRLTPFQIYFNFEHIALAYSKIEGVGSFPSNFHALNLRFGLNYTFGYQKKEDKSSIFDIESEY